MRLAMLVGLVMLVGGEAGAQTIPLTGKLTSLNGGWMRDPGRGWGGICGVPVLPSMEIVVSPSGIKVSNGLYVGTLPLDGTETRLSDNRLATVSTDAGWLMVTLRRPRPGGSTNVMRETYIVRGEELTVWRVLNVELADGSQGKIDCGNHHAIVYRRK